jgi:hypothetical protein
MAIQLAAYALENGISFVRGFHCYFHIVYELEILDFFVVTLGFEINVEHRQRIFMYSMSDVDDVTYRVTQFLQFIFDVSNRD